MTNPSPTPPTCLDCGEPMALLSCWLCNGDGAVDYDDGETDDCILCEGEGMYLQCGGEHDEAPGSFKGGA